MYSQQVMDHFMNPRNVGEIDGADGIGTVGNAKCGDIMRIFLKVENGIIEDVKFKTFGCGAAIATSSMATEMVKGKTLEEALRLTNQAVATALGGLPPVKVHCSMLAEQAIKSAVEDYLKRLPPAEEPGSERLREILRSEEFGVQNVNHDILPDEEHAAAPSSASIDESICMTY